MSVEVLVYRLEQVEVPLLYYFPAADIAPAQDRARAFVYEVRDDPRDSTRQVIEIVVDGGRDLVLSELHVNIRGDRLVISGERGGSGPDVVGDDLHRQLIKQYTLPTRADVAAITSRRCDDGRLAILVPVRR